MRQTLWVRQLHLQTFGVAAAFVLAHLRPGFPFLQGLVGGAKVVG